MTNRDQIFDTGPVLNKSTSAARHGMGCNVVLVGQFHPSKYIHCVCLVSHLTGSDCYYKCLTVKEVATCSSIMANFLVSSSNCDESQPHIFNRPAVWMNMWVVWLVGKQYAHPFVYLSAVVTY